MKEFNLELAKQGYPVCTRNGRKARILTFDRQCNTPIVALVDNSDEYNDTFEVVCSYHEDGKYELQGAHPNDLMMASQKYKGWVNIYRDGGWFGTSIKVYQTKEGAIKEAINDKTYIGTTKIEWEE